MRDEHELGIVRALRAPDHLVAGLQRHDLEVGTARVAARRATRFTTPRLVPRAIGVRQSSDDESDARAPRRSRRAYSASFGARRELECALRGHVRQVDRREPDEPAQVGHGAHLGARLVVVDR